MVMRVTVKFVEGKQFLYGSRQALRNPGIEGPQISR
jgi:hypothetical protein